MATTCSNLLAPIVLSTGDRVLASPAVPASRTMPRC